LMMESGSELWMFGICSSYRKRLPVRILLARGCFIFSGSSLFAETVNYIAV